MKIQTIYIRMLEGVETFVPVEAKMINEECFEILGNADMDLEEDVTSIYEFFPGDIVKCERRKDYFSNEGSNGTFLLASQLMSSTFPNRKIFQLIYLIVKSLGELRLEELKDFEDTVFHLCSNKTNILQTKHPIVRKWIEKNCR